MIKKIWITSLISLLVIGSIPTSLPALQAGGGMGQMGQEGLIPQPTEEEMRYIMEEFLPNLTDEELEELAKLGEEMIKAAEKEGIPLWQPPTNQQQVPKKNTPPKKTTATSSGKDSSTQKVSPSTTTKKLLNDLVKVISSIRQKSSTNAELEDIITKIEKDLNSLIYFIHVLNDEKLIKYLVDKEFPTLLNNLKTLFSDLTSLDDSFSVPQLKIKSTRKQEDAYKAELKKSKHALEKIIQRFKKSFTQEDILKDIEELLRKYEPEALKIKKELDSSEKKASEFIKKIPKTNINNPFPSYGNNAAHRGAVTPVKPGAAPTVTPGSSTRLTQPKATPQTTPTKAAPPKKVEPKKPTPAAGKPTIASLNQSIITKLNEFESFLTSNSARLTSFIHGYKNNKNEDKTIKAVLQEANFKMKRLKKDVDSWDTLVDKESKGFKETVANKKKIQDLWNNKFSHSQFKNLISKMNDLEKNKITLQGELKNFNEVVKKIVKKILEI